nr:MAG TPA: hypothetical protein [Caudoviricetes sp.]DAM43700.1 MAG TPA: hypothetical protein [Caudoviricetes sp.]
MNKGVFLNESTQFAQYANCFLTAKNRQKLYVDNWFLCSNRKNKSR